MLIEMFEYSIITRDGEPIAGGLSWQDVQDMCDITEVRPTSLEITAGSEARDKLIVLPPMHPDEVELVQAWGTIRALGNVLREQLLQQGHVVSEQTRRDLMLSDDVIDLDSHRPLPDNVRPFRKREVKIPIDLV